MNKRLALLCALCLLLPSFHPGEAEDDSPWGFTTAEGGAAITEYRLTGDSVPDTLRLPDTLGGYPVVGIKPWAFDGIMENGFTTLIVPASVTTMEEDGQVIVLPDTAKELVLEEGNPVYHMTEGVLYRDATALLACPGDERDKITLEEGTRALAAFAMYGLNNLKTLILPASFDMIPGEIQPETYENEFFSLPVSLQEIRVAEGNAAYHAADGLLYRGETLVCCPRGLERETVAVEAGTETIMNGAFSDCDHIQAAELPSSLKTIQECAFYSCKYLKTLRFSQEPEQIAEGAFQYNWRLTDFLLPDGSLSYSLTAEGALIHRASGTLISWFSGEKPEEITVPQGIKAIGAAAFSCLNGMKRVHLPDTLKRIGPSAFSFTDLTEINFPDGLTEMEQEAFYGCDALVSVSLPPSLKKTGDEAFMFCEALREVSFSEGLEEISREAFYHCTALDALSFPRSLKTIGELAFCSCAALRRVEFHEGLEAIEAFAFDECTALDRPRLPISLQRIEWWAFETAVTLSVAQGSAAHDYCKSKQISCLFWSSMENLYLSPWYVTASDDKTVSALLAQGGAMEWRFEEEKTSVRMRTGDGAESLREMSSRLDESSIELDQGYLKWRIDLDGTLTLSSSAWTMTLIPEETAHAAE